MKSRLSRAIFRAVYGGGRGKLPGVSSTLTEPMIDYRRVARRVRCQLEHDPINKQNALAALATRADRDRRAIAPEPVPSAENGVRAFAQAVSTALEGPILRFSRRQQLIRQAEKLGIRRFDANLLIAAVQHRLGSENAQTSVQPAPKRSSWRFAIPIGLAIGVQAIIVFVAWGLLRA